jgi:hypothetical protein
MIACKLAAMVPNRVHQNNELRYMITVKIEFMYIFLFFTLNIKQKKQNPNYGIGN